MLDKRKEREERENMLAETNKGENSIKKAPDDASTTIIDLLSVPRAGDRAGGVSELWGFKVLFSPEFCVIPLKNGSTEPF